MEYDGPRALGSRCILASPEMKDARDKLNHYLRHLGLSHPFALLVPEEYVPDIFQGNSPNAQFLSSRNPPRQSPQSSQANPVCLRPLPRPNETSRNRRFREAFLGKS